MRPFEHFCDSAKVRKKILKDFFLADSRASPVKFGGILFFGKFFSEKIFSENLWPENKILSNRTQDLLFGFFIF